MSRLATELSCLGMPDRWTPRASLPCHSAEANGCAVADLQLSFTLKIAEQDGLVLKCSNIVAVWMSAV